MFLSSVSSGIIRSPSYLAAPLSLLTPRSLPRLRRPKTYATSVRLMKSVSSLCCTCPHYAARVRVISDVLPAICLQLQLDAGWPCFISFLLLCFQRGFNYPAQQSHLGSF
jgi:hypothetical protein